MINVFSRKATGFHKRFKLFEVNFFYKKKYSFSWSNGLAKLFLDLIDLQVPALSETPLSMAKIKKR